MPDAPRPSGRVRTPEETVGIQIEREPSAIGAAMRRTFTPRTIGVCAAVVLLSVVTLGAAGIALGCCIVSAGLCAKVGYQTRKSLGSWATNAGYNSVNRQRRTRENRWDPTVIESSTPQGPGPRVYTMADPQAQRYLNWLNMAYKAGTMDTVKQIAGWAENDPPGHTEQVAKMRGLVKDLGELASPDEVRAVIDHRMATVDQAAADIRVQGVSQLRVHKAPRRVPTRGHQEPGQDRSSGPDMSLGQQEFIVGPGAGGMNTGAGNSLDIS